MHALSCRSEESLINVAKVIHDKMLCDIYNWTRFRLHKTAENNMTQHLQLFK